MQIEGEIVLEAEASVASARPVWILSHPHPKYGGDMSNKIIDQLYRRAVERGISVLRYNFRGVGSSQGAYDEGVGEVDDLMQVVAYVSQTWQVEHSQIHLIGYSFGSYISAMVADKLSTLSRLSLIAPPTQMVAFPQLTVPFPVDLYMPSRDEYTDPEHAKAYLDGVQAPTRYIEIADADHFFVGSTKRLIDTFFDHQGDR